MTGEGYGSGGRRATCPDVVLHVYFDPDPEGHLAWHVEDMRASGETESAERLEAQYRAFAESAPPLLTARLWHDRSRFDPLGMLTSSFAHARWDHVIFNLIFFLAFAAAVELMLGPVLFLGTIAVRHLEGLASKNPTGLGLRRKLKAVLVAGEQGRLGLRLDNRTKHSPLPRRFVPAESIP